MKTRSGFIFYRSFRDMVRELDRPDLEQTFLRAIVDFGLDRTEPDFGTGSDAAILRALWLGVRPTLTSHWTKFENGSNSPGAPAGNHNAAKEEKQPKNNRDSTEKQPTYKMNDECMEDESMNDALMDDEKMKEEKMNDEGGSETAPAQSNSSSFVVPSLDEVKKYFDTQHLNGDSAGFYDHYSANGWMIGKSQMKDWRAAARSWSRKQKNYDKPTKQDYRKDIPFTDADYKSTIF